MKALDLFCCGGGAAEGLMRAGFEVVGIDKDDHSESYPGTFIQGDIHNLPVNPMDFDLVWASPPCQKFSTMTSMSVATGNLKVASVDYNRECSAGANTS